MKQPILEINDLHAGVENKQILKGFSLTINAGEVHALMGRRPPSRIDALCCAGVEELPEGARRALERARAEPLSYAVRILCAPDGRLVVVLGEAHLKLAKAAEIGKDVVSRSEERRVGKE